MHASILARTSVLIAGAALIVSHARPETWTFTNDTATYHVQIDYDRYPAIPYYYPETGLDWPDFDVDTTWLDTLSDGMVVKHVRYNRAYRVVLDGNEGSGYDYIHYVAYGYPHHRDVQYEASSGFSFRIGDLYKTWFAQGVHLVRNEELDPYMQEGIRPGAWYGIDTWDPVLQQQVEWTAAMYQGSHPGWGNARSLEARSDAPRTKRPQGKAGLRARGTLLIR